MRLFFCELFMLVIGFGAHFELSKSSPAPTCITSGYLAKKEEATSAQLEEVAALPILGLDRRSESYAFSTTTDAVYDKVLHATNTSPSSRAAASFYEAIAEVASAYYRACYVNKSASGLELSFAAYYSAREKNDTKTLREAFGSATCLKKTLSSRKKRAPVKRDIMRDGPTSAAADVKKFFDSLDATDMGMIFLTTSGSFSVAFVIDDTGSMREEIEAVNCLVRSLIRSERDRPSKYILGTFNDPEDATAFFAPKSYNTDSLSDMQDFISDLNSIVPNEGGDGPEYGIGAIKRAFNASIKPVNPESGTLSQILLFTDSTAKDYSDINDVFLLIDTHLNVVVSAFLPEGTSSSKSCGTDYTSLSYQTCIDGTMEGYDDLVDKSGGILVGSLTNGNSLSEFINKYNNLMGPAAQLKPIDCSMREKRSEETPVTSTRGRRLADLTKSFVVSDLTDQFQVTITTASADIQIINPEGTIVISKDVTTIGLFPLNSEYNIMVPGTWKVTSTSAFSMEVSRVENNFVFAAEILDDSLEPLDSLPPFGCTAANQSLLIFTPHLQKLSRSPSATFNATMVTADGEVLGRTRLEHCGAYFRGRVTIPGRPFYIQFNGITKENYVFNATVYNRFNPTPWTLKSVLTSSNTEVSAGGSSDLTFRLTTNTSEWPSCSLTVNIEASATLSGISLAVTPRQVTLCPSTPADFVVQATAASGAAPTRGRLELSFRGNHDGKELHATTESIFIEVQRPRCPCHSGGTCSSFRRGSRVFNRCLCPTGYYGVLCERT